VILGGRANMSGLIGLNGAKEINGVDEIKWVNEVNEVDEVIEENEVKKRFGIYKNHFSYLLIPVIVLILILSIVPWKGSMILIANIGNKMLIVVAIAIILMKLVLKKSKNVRLMKICKFLVIITSLVLMVFLLIYPVKDLINGPETVNVKRKDMELTVGSSKLSRSRFPFYSNEHNASEDSFGPGSTSKTYLLQANNGNISLFINESFYNELLDISSFKNEYTIKFYTYTGLLYSIGKTE